MSTTQILGPYESRSPYRDLHFDAAERAAFLHDINPQTGDGAARSALPPAVAARDARTAPSPSTVDGGAR